MLDKKEKRKQFFKKNKGLLFVTPWILAFILFTLGPLIASIYMSMTDWGIAGPITGFIGLDNYRQAFTSDGFWHSLHVTVKYAILAVPLGMISSLIAALLLDNKLRGDRVFRVLYYLPVVAAGVAIAVMWKWILAPAGLLNMFLGVFNIDPIYWLNDPQWVIPSYVIMATWSAFSGYLTYLVALKDIPDTLGQNSKILGIGYFENLFKVTIPLMKPILTYNLIMAIIASFRKFSDAYIIGGAGGEGDFYMVYFYKMAFEQYQMGYAIALAWISIIILLVLVALVYKQTPFFEYYSGQKKKKELR